MKCQAGREALQDPGLRKPGKATGKRGDREWHREAAPGCCSAILMFPGILAAQPRGKTH